MMFSHSHKMSFTSVRGGLFENRCGLVEKIAICFITIFVMSACGSNKGVAPEPAPVNQTDLMFQKASQASGVPVRMLLAVSYLESRIQPRAVSSRFLGLDNQTTVTKSLAFGGSAFGLSLDELGVASDPKAAVSLETQLYAYASFVKNRLQGTQMPVNVASPSEKLRWIWKLAEIHRGADLQSKNLYAIFSREMIKILNEGFEVTNVESGDLIRLTPEGSPIKEDQLPVNLQQDLALDTYYHADIRPAHLFSNSAVPGSQEINKPKKVEVIHCPLTLSACLNLQIKDGDSSARMQAHYVIPNDPNIGPGIIQMARHGESVTLVNQYGTPEVISDRIVVMLTGNSGRYVDGVRVSANPMWLTDYQLRLLAATLNEVCYAIERAEGLPRNQCLSVKSADGLSFRRQDLGFYLWGQISEFDETIFYPYLGQGESGLSSVSVDFDGLPNKEVEAGNAFSLTMKFQNLARRVDIERLVRCPDETARVVWEPIGQEHVRNVTTATRTGMKWYDAGPNGTGEQFVRVKVFGEGQKFLGWSTNRILVKNFESNSLGASDGASKYCLRNGT